MRSPRPWPAARSPLMRCTARRRPTRADRFRTLLTVYDLHTAPLEVVGALTRHQGHPALAELMSRLEAPWLAELAQA